MGNTPHTHTHNFLLFLFFSGMDYHCNDGGFCDRRLQFVIAFLSNTDVFTTESMQKYKINGADSSDFCPPKVYMNLDFIIMQLVLTVV